MPNVIHTIHEYVWLVDSQHKVNLNTFDWVSIPFEQHYIHPFRMPYQLTEKYPQEMGGIRLVTSKMERCRNKNTQRLSCRR